jgi:uncharacterized protein (TIGR02996 family)
MVVVQIRIAGTQRWERRVFASSFWIGRDPGCEVTIPGALPRHVQVVIDDPDVTLTIERGQPLPRLDRDIIDPDFVHVMHVGNVLEVGGTEIAFELVTGFAEDVERFITGQHKHVLDDTEWQLLDALRANPDDGASLDVYADWLDQHQRPLLAEYIRLQRLRDSTEPPTDPSAFQSAWLSAQPAAVQLRLRDLTPLAEPWWRALVSRVPTLGCASWVIEGCAPWQQHLPGAEPGHRTCRACRHDVFFCWTVDDIETHGRARERIAIDPGMPGAREHTRDYRQPADRDMEDTNVVTRTDDD